MEWPTETDALIVFGRKKAYSEPLQQTIYLTILVPCDYFVCYAYSAVIDKRSD